MKRAVKVPQYSDTKQFSAPQGVVVEQIDKVTNLLATPSCPQTYTVAFIAGTEPKQTCDQAFTDNRGVFSKILGIGSPPAAPPPADTNGTVQTTAAGAPATGEPPEGQSPPAEPKKKRGFSAGFSGARGTTRTRRHKILPRPAIKGTKIRPNRSNMVLNGVEVRLWAVFSLRRFRTAGSCWRLSSPFLCSP